MNVLSKAIVSTCTLYVPTKVVIYRKELRQTLFCLRVVQPQAICWSTGSQLEWQCTCFLLL